MAVRRGAPRAARGAAVLCLAGLVGCTVSVPIRARRGASSASGDEDADRVRVRRIAVAFSDGSAECEASARTREEALERAGMIGGLVASGEESFGELATRYGDPLPQGASSLESVLVRGEHSVSDEEERTAFRLEPGEVSRPIETSCALVLLQRAPYLEGRASAVQVAAPQASGRACSRGVVACVFLNGPALVRVCRLDPDGCESCYCVSQSGPHVLPQPPGY